ncbi:MAG: LptF/LptG family permease [Sphingosinicella sp.]
MAEAVAPVLPSLPARRPRPRPGLIDRYIIRGVAGPFLAITAAVVTAMMLERSLRLIHELAARGADIAYLLPLLGQLAPYYLNLALPAAFMIALVLLVARLDDRLELEAMLASGLSLSRIAAPLVAFGVAVGLASLLAGGWLEPLGRHGFRSLRIEAVNAGRIGRLAPRAFYHPADSLAVTFDGREEDGRVRGIFVWQRLADGRELVLTGQAGRIGFAPRGSLFGIDLEAGRHVIGDRGSPAIPSQVGFDQLQFRESLRLEESDWPRGWDQKELTLPELAAAMREGSHIPRHRLAAEYYSRLALAAIMPLLPLLVLPLAFATKKGRRALGLVLCGIFLAAVYHGIDFAKKIGLAETADPLAAVVAITAAAILVIVAAFVSGRHLPSHSPIDTALQPLAERLARLTPEERAAPPAAGRTIAAYLGWQLGKWTLIALVGVAALLQMVDLFDRSEKFVERGMGLGDVGYYLLLRLPMILQQAMPLAALAGAMAAFMGMNRSQEITALRAAGISQWRILAMALPVPLLLSLGAWLLAETIVPQSQLRFSQWWTATEPEAPAPRARWFRIGSELVRAGGASSDGSLLHEIDIFRRDDNGLLAERISAATATGGADGWTLSEVRTTRFGGPVAQSQTATGRWPAALRPADVAALFSASRTFSARAAQRRLEEQAPISQDPALYATRLHRSAAEPLAPILMLLLALPLAFVSPRTGIAWPALLYAGGGGLLYLAADGVLTVAAQVGYLPALVGAWAAPAIAALTGLTVLLYSER